MQKLERLGWSDFHQAQLSPSDDPGLIPARVIEEHRGMYRVATGNSVLWAEASGKFSHEARSRAGYPAVGDWLLIQPDQSGERSVICRMLERKTSLSRKAAGTARTEQLVASNVDVAFAVLSLKEEMNLNRLERYLTLIKERRIEPVALLTKADLCAPAEAEAQKSAIIGIAPGMRVHCLSSKTKEGIDVVASCLAGHRTGVLLGSSGAGKSTLINALVGSELHRVGAVRESDERGRHTTTMRSLVTLPGGGMIIDTPGVRELQLWEAEDAGSAEFDDIEALTLGCKFSNCGHGTEPGCKVQAALKDGTLDARRHGNYMKIQRERNALLPKHRRPR